MINISSAATLSCQALFTSSNVPTIREVLELINKENNGFLYSKDFLQEREESLSFFKKRSLRNLLNKIDLDQIPSRQSVERYAVDLGLLLFGNRDVLDRWIKKDADQRLKDSAYDILKSQLIKDGLLKAWSDHYDPANISLKKKVLDRVWRFLNSNYFYVLPALSLQFPYFLPKFNDAKISKELMFKVIRDGYKTHEAEIIVALKSQSRRDAFNTFRRLYTPIILSVLLISQMQVSYNEHYAAIDAEVKNFTSELKQQRELIDAEVPKIKISEAQLAYEKSLQHFINIYGEKPTDVEDARMRSRIETDLGINSGTLVKINK